MEEISKDGAQGALHETSCDDAPQERATPLEVCQQELAEMKTKYLYLTAEFDNHKKRTIKERAVWTETAQEQALLDLLAVHDDLSRAVAELEIQSVPEEVKAHFSGVALIVKSFDALLKKYGIEEIAVSKSFDPVLCEAVMQQVSPDRSSGEVVAVLQKGYQRNGRVLRPAKVSVAP